MTDREMRTLAADRRPCFDETQRFVPSTVISAKKPRLLIENSNPHQTVATLRDILAAAGGLYDRGVPVRFAFDQMQRGTVAQVMTPDALVLTAHATCQPYILKTKKDDQSYEADARLPRSLAVMYLDCADSAEAVGAFFAAGCVA